MTTTFEHGIASVRDLSVETTEDKQGRKVVSRINMNDRSLRPTPRFWKSLHLRFGFTDNIFRYFSHEEVFNRISERAPSDQLRFCIEHEDKGDGKLLAVTSPTAPVIGYDDLQGLLEKYGTDEMKYADGIVSSRHSPRFAGGPFQVAGDGFENKFVIDTPIDGFGRPSIYLSMMRLICSNGMVAYNNAFRSEITVSKGEDGTEFALIRALDGFNNEEGFSALRQRFESASKSWASVNEVNKLYRTLTRLHSSHQIRGAAPVNVRGGESGHEELITASPMFGAFHKMTGDLSQIYGLANLNSLTVKRQRTLPTACRVYDLINFATEVATHHATPEGNRNLQAWLGDVISHEYDLEGTAEHFADWRDFFISDSDTTETLADMNRRSH